MNYSNEKISVEMYNSPDQSERVGIYMGDVLGVWNEIFFVGGHQYKKLKHLYEYSF